MVGELNEANKRLFNKSTSGAMKPIYVEAPTALITSRARRYEEFREGLYFESEDALLIIVIFLVIFSNCLNVVNYTVYDSFTLFFNIFDKLMKN